MITAFHYSFILELFILKLFIDYYGLLMVIYLSYWNTAVNKTHDSLVLGESVDLKVPKGILSTIKSLLTSLPQAFFNTFGKLSLDPFITHWKGMRIIN